MDEQIRKTLFSMSLNFDSSTIDEVISFLNIEIGTVHPDELPYHICAASAIVSECRKIPCVGANNGATNGIKVENIMRHLPGLSKQKFLETVVLQINKSRETPNWLLQRVDALSISYRIFKKYSRVFLDLAALANLDDLLLKQSLQFFWIAYLFIKNKSHDPSNTVENTRILVITIRAIFTSYLSNMAVDTVNTILMSKFQDLGEIPEQTQVKYQLQLHSQVQQIYQKRHQGENIDIKKVLQNSALRLRLLDDLSNQYDKFYTGLSVWLIDEMTYLELNRNVTPQQYSRRVDSSQQPMMNRMIDFEKEDQPEEKNTATSLKNDHNKTNFSFPKNMSFMPVCQPSATSSRNRAALEVTLSPFRKIVASVYEQTPVRLKIKNMEWIRQCLDSVSLTEAARLESIFTKYCSSEYQGFRDRAMQGIMVVIKEFIPNCMEPAKRQNQMYMLYMYFLGKITAMYPDQDNLIIFSSEDSFSALLCISVELFNYSYQFLTGQFRRYCQIFKIGLLGSFKPINWIGRHCGLSKSLETHLFQLQKQILIREIWEDDTGYQILTDTSQKMGYADCATQRRLKKHVADRIDQLCKVVKIEDKYIRRMVQLVNSIIEKKAYLLKRNKIDQIIICSVTFCIKQGQTSTQHNLEDIFTMYNTTPLSINSIRNGLVGPQGNLFNLLDFYNEVFLEQAQEMLNEDNALLSLLSTPMRAQVIQNARNGQNTSFYNGFRDQSSSAFTLGDKRMKTARQFMKTLAVKTNPPIISNQEDEDEEDDHESALERNSSEYKDSPRFGEGPPSGLYRNFSFGKK